MSYEDILKRGEHQIAHLLRHHHTSTAPAAAQVTINHSTPGGPVSLAADLKNFADRLETIGEDVVTKAEAVTANPEAGEIFDAVAHLAGLNLAPGLLGLLGAGIKNLSTQLQAQGTQQQPAAAAEPSFTPAGPQVAGQA